MEEDSSLTQERKSDSLSVSELRARLNGQLPIKKCDSDQEESNKSSIRSLESSFDMSKEEISPIAKKIYQFQAQNSPAPLSGKGSLTHARAGSVQPATNALIEKPSASPNLDLNANTKSHNKTLSSDASTQPPISSPSVAALRSQLALNPAMFRPGESGGIRSSRSIKGQSGDASSKEIPMLPQLDTDGPVSVSSCASATPKSSSKVSDIQQRLALDPNMLLPSPLSGPPSRGHRRGRSTANAAATNQSPEVSHSNQMNRPLISNRSRRSRTSTKFSCDEESNQTFEEVAKLTSQLQNQDTSQDEKPDTESSNAFVVPNSAKTFESFGEQVNITEKVHENAEKTCSKRIADTTTSRSLTQQEDFAESMQAEAKQNLAEMHKPRASQDLLLNGIPAELNTNAVVP